MSERGVCICSQCGCQFSEDRKAEMERIIARQGRAEDVLRESRAARREIEAGLRAVRLALRRRGVAR